MKNNLRRNLLEVYDAMDKYLITYRGEIPIEAGFILMSDKQNLGSLEMFDHVIRLNHLKQRITRTLLE